MSIELEHAEDDPEIEWDELPDVVLDPRRALLSLSHAVRTRARPEVVSTHTFRLFERTLS